MPYSVWPSAATRAAPSGTSVVAMPGAAALTSAGQAPTITSSGDFSTSFPATENPISQGSIWLGGSTNGTNWQDMQTTTGKAFACGIVGQRGQGQFDDCLAVLKTSYRTFTAKQFVETVVSRTSSYLPSSNAHEMEHLLRFSISSGDAHGYEVLFGLLSTGQFYGAVVRWNGSIGSYTAIYDPGAGSVSAINDGDVLRSEISGNLINVYRNGSILPGFQNIDVSSIGGTVWSSGQPGMGSWPESGSTLASYGWKSLKAGDL